MNREGFSDSESELLKGMDGRGWGRIGVTVEGACLVERPIMVSNFEDTFRAGECGDSGMRSKESGVVLSSIVSCQNSCCVFYR